MISLRLSTLLLGSAVAISFAACGDSSSSDDGGASAQGAGGSDAAGGSGGATQGGGSSGKGGSGGKSAGGGGSSAGGSAGKSTGGASSTGGTSSAGGQTTGPGGASQGGHAGTGGASAGGKSGAAGAAGEAGTGGAQTGGNGGTDAGGNAAGGESGAGGESSTAGGSGGAGGNDTAGGNGGSSAGDAGGSSGNGGSDAAGGNAGAAIGGSAGAAGASSGAHIQNVWIILMENHNWSDILGSKSAPYINKTLLPIAAHAEAYVNLPGLHPSEPNYLWLEAGDNFGIFDDNDPSQNSQPASTPHLSTQLKNAGISWKSYQEDIKGGKCPLTGVAKYAPKHNPFVFFDDTTGAQDVNDPYCIAHIVPYTDLATDLASPARYNFLTPNLCNDMHDSCSPLKDPVLQGDTWLSNEIPKIMASAAYQSGGAIFITWDESEGGDVPIGMIVLSPFAKAGYASTGSFTHSSTLRTMQEIFAVTPLLGGAANATDLSDLFTVFP